MSGQFVLEVSDPAGADAVWAMEQYFAELDARFEAGFDAGSALADAAAAFTEPAGVFVLVRRHGDTVGCGGLQVLGPGLGEIKRMWVAAGARGNRLGPTLLAALEGHARRLGCSRVVLDTNRVLHEAISMYRGLGYTEIDRYNDNPYAHHWFARDLSST